MVAGSARAALQPRYSWGCRSQQGKEEFFDDSTNKEGCHKFHDRICLVENYWLDVVR